MATGNPYMTSSTCEVLRLNRFTETLSNFDVHESDVFRKTQVLSYLDKTFPTDPFDTPQLKHTFFKNKDLALRPPVPARQAVSAGIRHVFSRKCRI